MLFLLMAVCVTGSPALGQASPDGFQSIIPARRPQQPEPQQPRASAPLERSTPPTPAPQTATPSLFHGTWVGMVPDRGVLALMLLTVDSADARVIAIWHRFGSASGQRVPGSFDDGRLTWQVDWPAG